MRKIKLIKEPMEVLEGAGVHLKRVFGYHDTPLFDPFLMLDDFRNDSPDRYLPGFPWHPHRGIETITYMLAGSAEHGDSIGNSGVIGKGDVQWMTAGSGIIHQEMPKPDAQGRMHGFQLWTNLPASHKMMPPRYRDIHDADIPRVNIKATATIKIICGSYMDTSGPAQDIVTAPQYWDVSVLPGQSITLPAPAGHTCFVYCHAGSGSSDGKALHNRLLALYDDGDEISISASAEGISFLYLCGKPLGEPISWRGPIVMNTADEIRQAFHELNEGTFIK